MEKVGSSAKVAFSGVYKTIEKPQVSRGKHLNNSNFIIGKKVFAFIKKDTLVIKLPKDTVQKLVTQKYAEPLVMGKKVMKEWVVIKHKDYQEYKNDTDLFKEAIAFISKDTKGGEKLR